MPDPESFDAFYARTVWNVTSQMHALAGEDSAADHAIREAYAKAYQQWYEIARYPDTQNWVLTAAKDAYQRRRPEAAPRLTPAGTGHDSLSWPGLYRPVPTPNGPVADPAATIGSPLGHVAAGQAFDMAAGHAADQPDGRAAGLTDGPTRAGIGLVSPPPAGGQAPSQSGHGHRVPPARRRPAGRAIALAAVIALIVAGGAIYLALGGRPAAQPGHHAGASKTSHKPAVRMLGAGRSGTRGQIPWSIVGSGWTLAEVSAAPAAASSAAVGAGTLTTYLVDPEGGRYEVQASSPGTPFRLLAWSGNGRNALFAVPSPAGSVTYKILSLTSGSMTVLPLPADVTAVSFTRPDGLNILAVRQTPNSYRLQRYNLQGAFQATIGTLPHKSAGPAWQPLCGVACGALSSPNGLTAVWGVAGDQMQLVGNAGGPGHKLDVPDSGNPPSCVPLTWWNTTTVLASCGVTGQPSAGSLWLVPSNGSAPTQLTGPSGSPSGQSVVTGAWQVAGATYVTETGGNQCPGAASGPGGLAVVPVSSSGSLQQPVSIPGTTNNSAAVVSVSGNRLLVLAQTSCPGTASLLWFTPSTGSATTVLAGQPGQAGVLAAAPYGFGPTAVTG